MFADGIWTDFQKMMNMNFRTSHLKLVSNADEVCHIVSDRQVDRICDSMEVGKEKTVVGLFHLYQSANETFTKTDNIVGHKKVAMNFKGPKSYRIYVLQ